MKIELTEKEVKATLEILALGYYIVGEGGCSQEKRKDYDSAISKVFGEYLQSMENVAVTERKIELSVEEYLDDVEDCLERYMRNNLLDNIAAALADYQYSVKDYITEVEQYRIGSRYNRIIKRSDGQSRKTSGSHRNGA